MSSMKEMSIRDYISKIDFKNDDWKLSQIKEDMRRFLGEEPGIDILYKKDVMVNEFTGESKEFKDIVGYMLRTNPSHRPSCEQLLTSILFISLYTKFNYFKYILLLVF